MPLYEYRCKNCGHEFEKMVRFSEALVSPHCPVCESEETEKKLSIFATGGPVNGKSSGAGSCSSKGGFS